MTLPNRDHLAALPCRPLKGRRNGSVTPMVLGAGLVLVFLFFLAVQVAGGRHKQLELFRAVEAAALAAANDLGRSDILLTSAADRQITVNANARASARRMALANRVAGGPLTLFANEENCTRGNIVLGTLNHPRDRVFNAEPDQPPDLTQPRWNAVRVAVQRLGAGAAATAFVDRDVIGFRITGSLAVPLELDALNFDGAFSGTALGRQAALPLVPIAILTTQPTDPAYSASWDFHIIDPLGPIIDNFRIGPNATNDRLEVQGAADGIREITVRLSGPALSANDNLQLVAVGLSAGNIPAPTDAASQLLTGIRHDQLPAPFEGRLQLGETYYPPLLPALPPPSGPNETVLPRLAPSGAADFDLLEENLNALRGRRRVWPLYRSTQVGPVSEVRLVGFVGARVMSVTRTAEEQLTLVLQPTQILTATALTDHTRRHALPRSIFNPYVAKVRLVE